MFLPYAAVAVITFTVLLNIFCLYTPVESYEDSFVFKTCQECVDSPCFMENHGRCITRFDVDLNFTCYTCPLENDQRQFFSEGECKTFCTDPGKTCMCDGACYKCIRKEFADPKNFGDCSVAEVEKRPRCP